MIKRRPIYRFRFLSGATACGVATSFASATGPGFFATSPQVFPMGICYDVLLEDFDGDDDLDALFTYRDDEPAQVWFNDGSGEFTFGQALPQSEDGYRAVSGDWDLDGDTDLCVTGSIYFNDGLGSFSFTEGPINQSIPNADSIVSADFDGDGDMDLAATPAFGGKAVIFRNMRIETGSAFFAPTQELTVNLSCVDSGDVDGDGDIDLFFGTRAVTSGSELGPALWLNDGSGHFVETSFELPAGAETSVLLVDLNNDGDLDAFVSTAEPVFTSSIWVNDGAGGFHDSGQRFPGVGRRESLPIDLDGDQFIDVINSSSAFTVESWLNQSGGQLNGVFQFVISEFASGVAVGDVDGDGDEDVFVAVIFGRNKLLINGGLCRGDVNQDGLVNGTDLAFLLNGWGMAGGLFPTDADLSGSVDGVDLATLLSNWGPCD